VSGENTILDWQTKAGKRKDAGREKNPVVAGSFEWSN
jgi:hypothetical protein